jgi:hypothetical protein
LVLRPGSLTAAAGTLCCSENLSTGVTGCSAAVLSEPDKVDQQEGETIMTLEDMDRDQLAEYELRRLNFSNDN